MDFDKVRFSKEHEWVAFEEGSSLVTIGITDFAAGELGDIVYIELPAEGTDVKFMETMGTIEAVKTVADIYAPVSGTVRQVNARLADDPGLVNNSPYGDGWFVKLEMSKQAELDELMTQEQYDEMIGKE